MLVAKNISKSYGDLQILKGVDFNVEEGEIVSIVGSSGAGKTTLLQVIGTLTNPDLGSILYNDIEVSKLKANQLAEFRNKNIGFIFQFHHLLPEFTALENVFIPSIISGESKFNAKKNAINLLDRLGLKDRIQHKPSELSGGEQQRVATARALINNPKIIFADEPSGNLDSETANELHQLFFDLRSEFNQTFVIVTHNNMLAKMCDTQYEMKDGKII
jgi:lipoprotein-releasing system ATP-binding protein